MKNFFQQWHRFWLRECPPHALAILRIFLGVFILFYVCYTFVPHVEMLFSNRGLVLPLFPQAPHPLLDPFFIPHDPWVAWTLTGLFLLGLIAFTVGYGMRMGILLVLFIGLYFWQLNIHHFHTSYIRIFLFSFMVLLFSGADRTLSLRMKLREGSLLAWEPICILPQRLLAVQISFTYLGVGWQKSVLAAWQGGEILSYSFAGRWGTAAAKAMLSWNLPMRFYDASLWVVKTFEFAIPFGLWIRRWRIQWWFFLGGAIFHTLISIYLAIWWFQFLIPAYILFLRPEGVQRWTEQKLIRKS